MNTPKQFLKTLLLFVTPLVAVLALIVGLGVYIGDALPISVAIQMLDTDEPVVYGAFEANRDEAFAFRLRSIQHVQPDVLFMGSSRIYSYGPYLIDEPYEMYNAWIASFDHEEVQYYLDNLDASDAPDVMLWCLDQSFFSPNSFVNTEPPYIGDIDFQTMLQRSVDMSMEMMRFVDTRGSNILSGTEPQFGFKAVGLRAMIGDTAVLNNGEIFQSVRARRRLETVTIEERSQFHRRRFEARAQQWVNGDRIAEENAAVVEAILDRAVELEMQVVGCLPPFSNLSYEWLTTSGDHTYLADVPDFTAAIFEQYGFPLFDFTDPATLPLGDEHFLDAWHITPYLTTEIYLMMLRETPDILGPYSSVERLENLLAESEEDPFFARYYTNDEADAT